MNTESAEAIPHRPEADSFDFKKSLELIIQAIVCHKLLIAVTMVLSVSLVIMYVVIFPANFEANVVLIGDPENDFQRDEFYNYWAIFRKHPLPDEGELMTSGVVIGQVVDKLGLRYEDVYHTTLNHIGYLWTQSWIGKGYRAVKYWLFPRRTTYALSPEETERAKTIVSFKDGVFLRVVPETNVGALVVRGPSPRVADIANTMIDLYMEYRRSRMLEEADTAYNALKAEADKAQQELSEFEISLEDHYQQNDMLLAFEKDKVQVGTWLELQASIVESEAQLAYFEETLREIDRQLATEEKEITSSRVYINNSARTTLRNQIVQLQIALEQTRLRFNEDAPEVVEIKRQISELTRLWDAEDELEQSQSTQLISETFQGLQSRRSVLLSDIEGLKANLKVRREADRNLGVRLSTLPGKIKRTNELEREHAALEKRYVGLSEKLMMADVSRATVKSAPSPIRVVDYAEYPEKPYWPKTKYLLLGAVIFGAGLGIFNALIIDFIFGRVSRYRLSIARTKHDIYAIVSRDADFLNRLYGLSGRGA